jgi:hypothetical protein
MLINQNGTLPFVTKVDSRGQQSVYFSHNVLPDNGDGIAQSLKMIEEV